MMAFRLVLPLVLMGLVVLGFPHDISISSEEISNETSEESSEETGSFEEFCPGEPVDMCHYKVNSCYEELQPNTQEEMDQEEALWREAFQECREREGGLLLTNKRSSKYSKKYRKINKCILEKLGIIVDGEINMPLINEHLERNLSNSTEVVRTAVFSAVKDCRVSADDERIMGKLHLCAVRACVSAI